MKATVRDHGPTELYTPQDRTGHLLEYDRNSAVVAAEALLTSSGYSIVFVHGLFGHAKHTWTDKSPHEGDVHQTKDSCDPPPSKKARNTGKELFHETFWPQDFLPIEFPNARIITWGYDVDIDSLLSDTSKSSIFHHAETLLADLVSLRVTEAAKKKPIIFVVHSLGGIVVKDALSLSKIEATFFKEVFPATIGVVFLGTPHRGSKAATLGKIAFEMSRIFLKNPNVKVLRALENNSEILERISRNFGYVLASGQIKVHTFREELKIQGMEIVESWSSTIGYLHESRSSLRANHRTMAKFSSADDINFKRVTSVLRRWINEIEPSRVPPNISTPNLNINETPDSLIYDEVYRQCLHALNVERARVRLQNVEPAYPDTYCWLYDDKLGFKAWLQGNVESDIYWVYGKPGSGKSTLMKHAMIHHNTIDALHSYSRLPWLITGYFFHDRGTSEQKTVVGFLREILYQMLLQRQDLFALIQDIHKERGGASFEISATWWNVERLRQALLDIGARTMVPLNCCLFVDALDEHDGKHRDLISLLETLAFMPKSIAFRLRLCVAGRPENIFKDAFNNLPGFAIHQYTMNDVRHYTKDRLRKEQLGVLSDKGKSNAHQLVDQIVRRAHGVFLWVRLVVDELIAGLCEGDTFTELELLLSEIPDELTDLYSRAIRRVTRTSGRSSARSVTRHKYETYVIFQMIIESRRTFPLRELIGASIFHAGKNTAEPCQNSNESMDDDQRLRRLNSRSAGLLESQRRSGEVQFLHQTVKEYMRSENGRDLLREGILLEDQEDGVVLTFRYIIKQLEFASKWSIDHFKVYAQALEKKDKPAAKWMDPTAKILCKDPETLRKAVQYNTGPYWDAGAEVAGTWLNSEANVHMPHTAYLVLFYICCDLPLSVDWHMERYRHEIDTKSAGTLFEAALLQTPDKSGSNFHCFRSLLEAGIGSDLSQQCTDWLDQRIQKLQNDRELTIRPGNRMLVLWERFLAARTGEDHNCKSENIIRVSTVWQQSDIDEGTISRPICL